MSNSISQASCKRQSGNPIRRNINELPDAILDHILSFLPTKEAIATSILSKRWLFVWTSVPVLDFEDSRRCKTDEKHRTAFADFVSRALILNRMGSLDKFRLECYSFHGPSRLNTWITDAIQRDFVREIDISIHVTIEESDFDYFKLDFFRLPSSFFIKNLKVLKLSHRIIIDIPNNLSVCFPSLKILHLVSVDYSNDGSASSLLRGCPVLEELLVKRYSYGDEVKIFTICVPTLKTLSYQSYLRAPSWAGLNIYAPMLEYLNLNIERYLVYLESAFNSIVQANVFFDEPGVSQLARSLCNAKFLSLKCVDGLHKALTLPSFPNLTKLVLRIMVLHWDMILHFLENAPNLEVLVLDYAEILTSAARETDERDCLPRHSSPCLAKVLITGFRGYRHELEMVKYILKNSRALKLMEICSSAKFVDSKFHMLQKLSEIPRHSEACQLKFK